MGYTGPTFQLVLEGAVTPETTRASDLADILKHIEKAITETARARGDELQEDAPVSLIRIEPGSNRLTLALAGTVVAATSVVTSAIRTGDYNLIPPTSHQELHEISKKAVERSWSVSLVGNHQTPTIESATISAEQPVPPPPPPSRAEGTSTILGQCLRVGGVKPKAEIRLHTGGILHIEVTQAQARDLARSLYEDVAIEGKVTWRVDDWTIERFQAERITSFQYVNPVEAFEELAAAAAGRWDDVDAEEYVRRLRTGGGDQ